MDKTKYYIGVDVGGSKIKAGVVDSNGSLLLSKIINTDSELGNEIVISNIVEIIKLLFEESKKLNILSFSKIGVGVPGIVDIENGVWVCSHNLKFYNFDLKKVLQQKLKIDVELINDANAFTLAEYYYGAGKNCKNIVMLTLGTGVGGGAIVNGKLLLGNKSSGAEFGHSVICVDGKKCSCGRNGCLEQYVSATALTNSIKEEMKNNTKTKMWDVENLNNVSAKIVFDYKDIDKSANKIFLDYIKYLSVGLTNIANIFRPELIILGGGIANQKNKLVDPLQEMINSSIFSSDNTPKVIVTTAELGYMAGVIGAVCNLYKKG